MSRLDRETLTGVDITPADGLLVLTKALPTSLAEWALKGIVRVSALAASKTRTLTLTVKTDGEHVFSTDWVFESDATDAGRVKRMAFRVPEDIRGTVTLHLHSTEATDTTVDVDARLNTDVDDVPNTWFVDATYGHDTEHDGRSWQTAFLTIDAAIAVAASGDTICTGPGIFALGAAVIELPDGVNLQGKGIDATLITSTAVLSTLGCIVKPGTGSRIADLTIQGIAGAGVYQAALGYRKASAGAPTQARFLHAWADRVRLIADADGVYIREEPDPGTRCDLVMRDCLIETKYDGVTIISRNASIVLYDTRIVVIGPSSCGGQYAHGLAGIGGSDAFISMVRGSLEVSGATVSNVGAQEARGRIILSDVHVDTAGAAPMDLVQADNGSVFVFGSVFDPAKTSGTIIHVPPGASILADTAALEARLTAERAARLDADVSSRATPADVTGAHGMTDGLIGGLGSPEQDGAVATAHATTDGKVDAAKASADAASRPSDVTTAHATTDGKVDAAKASADAAKASADEASRPSDVTTAHATTDGKVDAAKASADAAKASADEATRPDDIPTPEANAAETAEVLAAAHGEESWESLAERDWTAGERGQIRDALGVAGDKTTAEDGQLQNIKTKTDLITAGNVRVRTPVAADGTITLMRGDSYLEVDDTKLKLDVPNYAGPDLTAEGTVLTFSVGPRREGQPAIFTVEASAEMDGTTLVLSADVASGDTAELDAPGEYLYDFQAVFASGGIFTPAAGKLLALADVMAEPEEE
ncbi:MAG TPA: hypothetical protein VM219_09030 [Phycisphaerae bacterium]|nr:hypothetical protein [Phycisphaerae bacterium]HUX02989.1 hypothetical protein [Phycisphaerae bacterium]